ncbi:MAG TPA: bacillithiol biosynthesis cysteine-adding enzyme BshC, partial [Terriglobales bacterium]|nr:bacillithiol biosynthesis cysteine-adding enzyme BshC [Terriglobales bacterium]
ATQDHDFAEVSRVTLRSAGELRSVALRNTGMEGAPVGGVKLGAEAAAVAQQAAAFLGNNAAAKDLLRCYASGETMGTAFGKLFSAVFGRLGLILFDPSEEAVGRLAGSVLAKAAELAPELTENLLARGRALENAGYEQQVKVVNSSTLLFATVDGARTPVRRVNGEFAIGTRKLKLTQLKQEIATAPQRFSGNALLRPVVQDFLLPTLAYIGGPAEIAYFAQAGVVYDKLLGRTTPILPRLSATVLDARDRRIMQRHKLSALEVLKAGNELREVLALRDLPAEVDSGFQHVSTVIDSSLERLGDGLKRLDPTLAEAGKRALSKMRYQLKRLRGRAARAQLKRNEELSRHAAILESSLYRNQELQEREIAGIAFLAQFGEQFLERLDEAARGGCKGHLVLPL